MIEVNIYNDKSDEIEAYKFRNEHKFDGEYKFIIDKAIKTIKESAFEGNEALCEVDFGKVVHLNVQG